MMKSKELRVKAWESLKGKYWMAFLATLIAGIIGSIGNSVVSFGQNMAGVPSMVDPATMDSVMLTGAIVILVIALVATFIGALLAIFVSSPLQVGVSGYFIKNTDSKPALSEIFAGFKTKYGRNVGAMLLVGVKTVLWSLLFVIPGIIKGFEYAIIPYILADDPTISTKDAFKKANTLMKGNKWRLFKLEFSFIGWILLSVLTFGVGVLFLMPYLNAAMAEFYVELKTK